MKRYITMSFMAAKEEVATWLRFFESKGIHLEIKEICVVPVNCPDNVIPQITEVGFEPVLVGETVCRGKAHGKPIMSYDEHFRIEEILTTGMYRWKTSEVAGVYNQKKVEDLSQAMVMSMLEEWTSHIENANHIAVKWKLKNTDQT